MANFGDFLSGAAGGAEAGLASGNPLIAAGSAIVGGISSLFGGNQQEKQMNEYRDRIAKMRTQAIQTGALQIGGQTQRNMSAARQAAGRRAAAMGRTGDTEAMTAPIESRAQVAGGEAMNQYLQSTNSQYDKMLGQGELSYASRSTQPSTGQYIQTLGGGVAKYMQNKDYIKALKQYGISGNSSGDGPYSDINPSAYAAPAPYENEYDTYSGSN